MADYIRERFSGEIIRDSARIYWDHFGTIFALYFFSGFLWEFIYEVLAEKEYWPRARWIFYGLGKLMPFIAGLQLTSTISQIYLGYELNIKRVFSRTEVLPKAVVTGLLVLLLFPLYPLFMFAVPITILEGVWGFKAIKRSYELGRHYRLRNVAVYVWPYAAYFILWLGYAFLVFAILPGNPGWKITAYAVRGTVFNLIIPLAYITAVLLYFDMRIRNEAYDIVSLAEELKK